MTTQYDSYSANNIALQKLNVIFPLNYFFIISSDVRLETSNAIGQTLWSLNSDLSKELLISKIPAEDTVGFDDLRFEVDFLMTSAVSTYSKEEK